MASPNPADQDNRFVVENVDVISTDDRRPTVAAEVQVHVSDSPDFLTVDLSDATTDDLGRRKTSDYLSPPDDGGDHGKDHRKSSSVTISPEAVEADEAKQAKKVNRKKSSFSLMASRPLKYYLTRDVLPHMDHYRNRLSFHKGKPNRTRPTLDELMEDKTVGYPSQKKSTASMAGGGLQEEQEGKVIKFGWFDGVYMRCLLNIWGVMLFLRLSWVMGQAGLIQGLAIITLSNIVTLITTISMSAVSTNGQIKAGGIYYMISRSLGPEFGGAIGLMFTLANSIAVSMYLIGFCESLMDMLVQVIPNFNGIVDSSDRINDIRLIGSICLVLILGLAIVGMDWVTRVQMGLLFLLIIAQADFIIGTFLPPSDAAMARGFVGYSGEVLQDNLWSSYSTDSSGKTNSFFTVFAVFFPAVTGIVAGANLSGDLKNPGVAIPKGTLLAIATTYVSYIVYGIMISGCTLRLASGVIEEVHFGTDLFNETVGSILNITRGFDDCSDRDCDYGSLVSQQMMEVVSAWGPLIYAGCFAATLSSAIASLVGAPRVFQAVAKDKLFPFIGSFAEGWGANNDPVRGYLLVFIISLVCILIGDLNMVSSLLSNFFVAAYALINFSVFHASITNSPGWRPSFKYYNKWVSLCGTFLCIIVMFLMDYMTALVTFICIISLYLYVYVRKPDVNWGSSSQSQSFVSALKAVQTLAKVEDHVKNYRPKLIVMTGPPENRPALMDFANLVTKRISLMASINVAQPEADWKALEQLKRRSVKWLADNHIKAFLSVTRNSSFSEGVRTAVELNGLGKLSPNMILFGFHQGWKEESDRAAEYLKAIQVSFDLHLAVGVLRVNGGLDISELFGENNQKALTSIRRQRTMSEKSDSSEIVDETGEPKPKAKLTSQNSFLGKLKSMSTNNNNSDEDLAKRSLAQALSMPMTDLTGKPIDDDKIERIIQFRNKNPKEGTIDVYWLYDDGGLTLLLPHILTTRAKFHKCKLRVFFLSDKVDEMDLETRNMATLLAKFRIECEDVIMLPDVTQKASKETRDEFKDMVRDAFDDKELEEYAEKTNFHLRIAESVRQHSINSALVVMTLPLLKRANTSKLYLAWLDFVTRNVEAPCLLVRGNQESVLTFYS